MKISSSIRLTAAEAVAVPWDQDGNSPAALGFVSMPCEQVAGKHRRQAIRAIRDANARGVQRTRISTGTFMAWHDATVTAIGIGFAASNARTIFSSHGAPLSAIALPALLLSASIPITVVGLSCFMHHFGTYRMCTDWLRAHDALSRPPRSAGRVTVWAALTGCCGGRRRDDVDSGDSEEE